MEGKRSTRREWILPRIFLGFSGNIHFIFKRKHTHSRSLLLLLVPFSLNSRRGENEKIIPFFIIHYFFCCLWTLQRKRRREKKARSKSSQSCNFLFRKKTDQLQGKDSMITDMLFSSFYYYHYTVHLITKQRSLCLL